MATYGNCNRPRNYENDERVLDSTESKCDNHASKGDNNKSNDENYRSSGDNCNTTTCLKKDCVRKQNEIPLTSQVQKTAACTLPGQCEHPHFFCLYGCQNTKQHPFYKTTSSDYGWFPPGNEEELRYPRPTRIPLHLGPLK